MMDHKYIEQLLERYWRAETSLAEEDILRTFFSQPGLPAHLAPCAPLFEAQRNAQADAPGTDFDERLRQRLEGEGHQRCKALRMTVRHRIAPLLKAAAAVAIVLTVGSAARHAFEDSATPADSPADVGSPYVKSERIDAVISQARREGDNKATALTNAAAHDTLAIAPNHAQADEATQ